MQHECCPKCANNQDPAILSRLKQLEDMIKGVSAESTRSTSAIRKELIIRLPSLDKNGQSKIKLAKSMAHPSGFLQKDSLFEPFGPDSEDEDFNDNIKYKISALHKRLQALYEEQKDL